MTVMLPSIPVGYSVFVVGVADVDMSELRNIGSKPSERHVFVVDDYDAFAKIQDNLITFICETATSSMTLFLDVLVWINFLLEWPDNGVYPFIACPLIYLDGFTSPGKTWSLFSV